MRTLERIAFVVLLAVAVFSTWYFTRPADAALASAAAARDTVYISDTLRVPVAAAEDRQRARADSSEHRSDALKATSDASSNAVAVSGASSLTVTRSDTVLVFQAPPEVVQSLVDLRATVKGQDLTIKAKDAALDSAKATRAADSLRIASRGTLIAKQDSALARIAQAPRWGIGATLGYGAGGPGTGWQITAGVSYSIPFPKLSHIFRL